MNNELGYANKMGPKLRAEVERQLLVDLQFYNVKIEGLAIDWSESCLEGHRTDYLDGDLEEWSGIAVVDSQNNIVAHGWIDFIHGGSDNPLFVFWEVLYLVNNNQNIEVREGFNIPQHVWDKLPESSKDLCVISDKYDARWCKDPLVIKWKATRGL